MRKYLIKRGLTMVVTFIGITIVVFAILRLAPGDPTQQKVDFGKRKQDSSRAQQLIRFKQAHHLDKPLFVNFRPYYDYRPEMRFWMDFLTWHVPARVRYLRNVDGQERSRLLSYFDQIRLPSPKSALDGQPFEIRQAARSAIRQTLLLNLADRDIWLLPIVYDEFASTRKRFRTMGNHVASFRSRMSDLQKKREDGTSETEVRTHLKQSIRRLEDRVDDLRVPPSVTDLDHSAPLNANLLILRAWLEQTSWMEPFSIQNQMPYMGIETGIQINQMNVLIEKRKTAVILYDLLEQIHKRTSAGDLSAAERSELRASASDWIESFSNAYHGLRLTTTPLVLNPDDSPRFNSSVAGLYAYRVRRRLDVVVRLLNNLTGDAFGATFRVPDRDLSKTKRKELRSVAENVAFLWLQGWWRTRKQQFEEIASQRRKKLPGIMKKLVNETDDFMRRRKIRLQLQPSDLPYMIEVLKDPEAPIKRRAVASQVLIEFAPAPENYQLDVNSSREDIESSLQLWSRWWEQNRSEYRFTLLEKMGHTVAQTQYSLYMWNLAHLNFGETMSSPVEPVYNRLERAIWRTGPLMLLATLFTYLMAIPLGIVCAVKQRTLTDRGLSVSLLVLWAIPGYAAALILIYFFANPGDGGLVQLFPAMGLKRYDEILWHLFYAFTGGGGDLGFFGHLSTFFSGTLNYLHHAFLPMFSTSVFGMASLALYSRVSMLEVIRKDYIRTARAKGLSEFIVIGKHVVRNGLNPIITLFANLLPRIVGGSLIIEIIFEIQGVGKMFFEAAQARDYNVMMCFLLISAVLVMAGILISDLLYVLVNPRLDFEEVET